ncbi:MAG TPA: hypothetical protein ACFCUC_01375 [Desulfobacterales bacterium]
MEKAVAEYIESVKKNKRIGSLDEASTKQALVIRVLSLLGWDIFNVEEVKPDHPVKSQRVDYALRINKMDKVFIDVKKVGDELAPQQKQLLGCALQEGVKLAVLTNGVLWWFFLAFSEGPTERKRFCSLDLQKQNPRDAALPLVELLARKNVLSGMSLKTAESMHRKRSGRVLEKAIGDNWSRMLAEPDPRIVELLTDSVEKSCGLRPEKERIVDFLIRHSIKSPAADSEPLELSEAVESREEIIELKEAVKPGYEGQSIESFQFNGRDYEVESWSQFIFKLCNVLVSRHDRDLEKLLWHSVDGRFYFREDPDELRMPLNIEGTNIFVETRLHAEEAVRLAHSVLSMFGYSANELKLKTHKT